MLVAGSTVVLFMLVVLVRAVNSSSTSVTPTSTGPHEAPAGATPGPTATRGSAPTAARSRTGLPLPGRLAPRAESDDGDRPAMPVDDHPPPATRANTKNLQYGGTQLRAQAAAVEPLVKKCVETANAAGTSPTGKAMLTYVVAQHGDKVQVEDTAIDDDKTTLQGEKLLECLRETARSMKFVGLPREAEALVVSRSITLDHGTITEYKHVGFSYLR